MNIQKGNLRISSKLDRKENIVAFLFVLIPIIGWIVFTAITLFISASYSFTNYNPLESTSKLRFVGFDNYKSLFNSILYADYFIESVLNTLFLLISIPVGISISLIIAAMMSGKNLKGSSFFRTLIYLPSVTSVVAINWIWRQIFHDDNGLINNLLGINIPWLLDFTLVKVAMIIKIVWTGMGFQIILLSASMASISTDFFEAAEIDGANGIRQFFSITLPLITPVIFFLIVTGLISGFQAYSDTIMFARMVPGSKTIVFFVWHYGINNYRYGLASAASMFLAIIIMIITIIQFKFSKWVYSE